MSANQPKPAPVHAGAVPMVELWRGALLESVHAGHAVVMHADGAIVEAWGRPEVVIYPRSSCKMLQALPLVERAPDTDPARLALACASHQGGGVHVAGVRAWLADMGRDAGALRCGVQEPADRPERDRLIRAGDVPGQMHNNCSGKHAGFLALNRRLGGDAAYTDPDHPVQRAVRTTFEEVTGQASPGYGIDGCAAPNFATGLDGLARAMARFAAARPDAPDARERAMARLRDAMIAHPVLVAGDGRACTQLMQAMAGQAAVKTGAEAVYVAMLPRARLGIALKIVDGATRAAEAAITALLIRHGALAPDHPVVDAHLGALHNRRRQVVGACRTAPGFA